ncbi:MAG: DEAD/DEAH box helicase family protein [candidate division WS1 bacterium]|jgi:excisionase family DNA binding protein|nr:DEAD/DEAH box helicase family protein [candidate division WS1 bacterium]
MDNQWMSTEAAAEYTGLSLSKIYDLAQERRIPHSRVGRQYRFRRADLDAWMLASRPVRDFFVTTAAYIDGNPALREPQVEAWRAAKAYFDAGGRHAIIQMPVGTGKTGVMALLPFGVANGRVLVVAPNLTIRSEIGRSLDVSDPPKCFWWKTGVLEPEGMLAGPFRALIDGPGANVHDCDNSHFVIANIQQLTSRSDRWLPEFGPDYFDMVLIDEGHHNAAPTWQRVMEQFPEAKICSLTATPFRSDEREVAGDLIYRYSFTRAMLRGYIKRVQGIYVAPDEVELSFVYRDETTTHTLEEVLELKEEEWFSRGVALSPECNKHIVDHTIEKLRELRLTGKHHQIIAVACSVDHAKDIRSLYCERGIEAAEIHSGMSQEEREQVFRDLRSGILDCVVQVQMLGEGFDHPELSIAAVFRPFRSLSPYIQFVGRVLRVLVQNDPSAPDNQAYVVSHIGMNLDTLFEDFKILDADDRRLFELMLCGETVVTQDERSTDLVRTRLEPEMVVRREIVSSFFQDDFIDPESELVLDDARAYFEQLGIDVSSEQLSALIGQRDQEEAGLRQLEGKPSIAVQPQRHRHEVKRRLKERGDHVAKILLNSFELSATGMELGRLYPHLGKLNLIVAIRLVQKAINDELHIETGHRDKLPTEQLERVLSDLSAILNRLRRQLAAKLQRGPISQEGESERG